MLPEKLQAIVLSSTKYGESDRIVTLFTLEHGRLKGFARGACNSRKRFGPALETFARIDVQLLRKEGLSSLRGADIIQLYSGIRSELHGIAYALYACELVECLTPEAHPLPRLYRLLTAYFEHIDVGTGGEVGRRFFEINLLNILGYRPSLDCCCRCGTEFAEDWVQMQQEGELVCRLCSTSGRKIELSALQSLNNCLATGHFGRILFDESSLRDAAFLLDESISTHVGRKLKSLEFLDQVRQ
ncbi:MAG TPA: DNA repair protein RecO [Desulfuromonadales bacterium]|nr:DNA repair protein RecO [Desulfuromonadales bacterium]